VRLDIKQGNAIRQLPDLSDRDCDLVARGQREVVWRHNSCACHEVCTQRKVLPPVQPVDEVTKGSMKLAGICFALEGDVIAPPDLERYLKAAGIEPFGIESKYTA